MTLPTCQPAMPQSGAGSLKGTGDQLRGECGRGAVEELQQVPGIRCVDHIGIAVRAGELDGQVNAYKLIGFREVHREEARGSDQVREVLLRVGDSPNLIQLLEPLSDDSPIQKLIDKNGGRGGLAHVAFRVENAQQAFDAMLAAGFRIIDPAPRSGSRGTTVFFVHPKSRADFPFGFLIEMVEAPQGSRE